MLEIANTLKSGGVEGKEEGDYRSNYRILCNWPTHSNFHKFSTLILLMVAETMLLNSIAHNSVCGSRNCVF